MHHAPHIGAVRTVRPEYTERVPSVYIESSIPSYYHETRRSIQVAAWKAATRLWWDRHRHRYDLCTSVLTLNEVAAGPPRKAALMLAMLNEVEVLDTLPGTAEVIDFYVAHRLMPSGAGGDAGRLAFASMHAVDFLLTWNCAHLANANKSRHLHVLNGRLGLSVPILTTPLTLIPENEFDAKGHTSER